MKRAPRLAAGWTSRFAWLKATTALTGAFLGMAPLGTPALAGGPPVLPTGGQVVSGSATITTTSSQVTVTEQSSRVVIDWSSYNIGSGGSVVYVGPNGHALTSANSEINLVTGNGGASQIGGSIGAGQSLFALSNPAGIVIQNGATVNVGSMIATTAQMSQQDIATYAAGGRLSFSVPGQNATVANHGTITVAQAGIAALVAPGVQNSGVINARLSTVKLASATTAYADFYGDGLVNVSVGGQVTQTPTDANGSKLSSAVENSGKIVADGGTVQFTANVARGVVNNAINMTGVVEAQAVTQQGGTIVLDGGDGIVTIASNGPGQPGLVDATGSGAGQHGGTVTIKGAGVVHTGTVDVSGAAGGGTIVLNTGDVLQGGILRADGGTGAGGSIQVSFTGSYTGTESAVLSADGGSEGGGIAVTGGAGSSLITSATHSVRSSGGRGGTVMLDAGTINLLAASVDASGASGGGTIAVGGGPRVGNLPAADNTFVSGSSTLSADALAAGDGGHIVIWSASDTEVAGALTGRGGVGGRGGLVEVSASGGNVGFAGTVDVTAPNGTAGTLLLDPVTITIANTTGQPQLIIAPAGAPVVQVLANGNIVVGDLNSFAGGDATGQVVLFDGKTGAVISKLVGTGTADDPFVGALTNGNFVLVGVNPIFVNGTTGATGVAGGPQAPFFATNLGIDYINALKASGNPFLVGFANGITPGINAANNPSDTTFAFGVPPFGGVAGLVNFTALPNGNFLVADTQQTIFGNGSGATQSFAFGSLHTNFPLLELAPPAVQAQLVTFNMAHGLTATGNNTTPLTVVTLSNGNGVVTTALGDTFIGANFNPANTMVQTLAGGGAVTALSNGNYVVDTPGALAGLGAITFGNGNTGIAGAITAANSLAGAAVGDLNNSTVTALANGNYVVAAPAVNGNVGAVTLGNGTNGITGTIGAGNSILGSAAGDELGSGGVIAGASGGGFVVLSPNLSGSRGAITLVTGGATQGTPTAGNSLIGTTAGDQLGSGGGAALTDGDFVVASPNFAGGKGAASFVNANGSTVGAVTASNSLIGNAGDHVGSGGILGLGTGNYLVLSSSWNGGQGAVTFANGTTGLVGSGVISSANSLIGVGAAATIGTADNATSLLAGAIGPSVGINPLPPAPTLGVLQLANGNYVVLSETSGVGAVTFGSGTTGVTGAVTAANSLIGAGVGDGGITLLPNGNYVVSSPFATVNGMALAGAVTFGNGSTGVTGSITAQNSLVGASPGDTLGLDFASLVTTPTDPRTAQLWQSGVALGVLPFGRLSAQQITQFSTTATLPGYGPGVMVRGAITVLASGDYVVASPNGLAGGALGAATFGSGTTGVSGTITAQNSILGNAQGGQFGSGQFGSYVQDDPALGTFVVSGIVGSAPAIESAGIPLSLTALLKQNSPIVPVSVLEAALAGGNTVVLSASDNIVILAPINAQGGKLVLSAGNEIIFNASEFGDIALDLTARTLVGNGVSTFSQLNTRFDSLPFQDPLIPQALAIVGNPARPSLEVTPAAVAFFQRCIAVRPDGSCETEAPGTIGDATAARGNAFLGDLLYHGKF